MHQQRIWSCCCYLAVILGAVLLVSVARAQGGTAATSSRTIDPAVGKVLNAAIELLNAKKYAEAEEAIAALDEQTLSAFAHSRVEQILFNIAYSQKQYDDAREHLQNAIAAGGLNQEEVSQVLYQSAQVLMVQERWSEGAAALEHWFSSVVNPNGNAYYLLAVAYYQMGDYERALPAVQRAIAMSDQPQETWLRMVVALQIKAGRYEDAIPVLQQLVALVPDKKTYWMQLSSAYGKKEDYRSALAIMQLAYNAGLVTEDSEIRRFVDLLTFNEVPARGARVLEAAIASKSVTLDDKLYEKLANCWIAAGEYDKALPPLERAAELAATGNLFVRLGELHVQRGEWGAAETALGSGIAKGGLQDPGQSDFLMGVALFEDERPQDARAWFELARQSDKWRDASRQYLDRIAGRVASPVF